MRIVFVSNYLNHHQIPFCEGVCKENNGDFLFIQTEPMETERVNMGWGVELSEYPFAKCYYSEPEVCKKEIEESDVVIFGGVEDESYIVSRLQAGKPVIRYSERIYREGQWKFISPRGLKKKYHDHIRYRNKPVYLLCAGAYVASDFHLIHAYPDKMYTWGYFPRFMEYRMDELLDCKRKGEVVKLLWAGRMIDLKHPEHALRVAKYLKEKAVPFQLTMVGEGELSESLIRQSEEWGLEKEVIFMGFCEPSQVREYMKAADIYLFTSDYKEGWGAVLNEAMNSGCAVVAASGIGAVPYLLQHEKNGMVYRNNDVEELCQYAYRLATDSRFALTLAVAAYETIRTRWNPEHAAKCLVRFCRGIMAGTPEAMIDGPLSKAPLIAPAKGYQYTRKER